MSETTAEKFEKMTKSFTRVTLQDSGVSFNLTLSHTSQGRDEDAYKFIKEVVEVFSEKRGIEAPVWISYSTLGLLGMWDLWRQNPEEVFLSLVETFDSQDIVQRLRKREPEIPRLPSKIVKTVATAFRH